MACILVDYVFITVITDMALGPCLALCLTGPSKIEPEVGWNRVLSRREMMHHFLNIDWHIKLYASQLGYS